VDFRRSAIAVLALFAAAIPGPAEEVVFAIGEWPPYVGEREPEQGGATALVTAACTAAGLQPTFRFFPWARAEQAVRDGTAFATFPFQHVPDDPAFRFSEPLFSGTWRVFHRRDNPAIPAGFPFAKTADLAGLRIADILGYPRISDDLRRAGLTVDPTPDNTSAFRKLLARRIDVVIEDQTVGQAVLGRIAPAERDAIAVLATPFGDPAVCTYLIKAAKGDPRAPALLERINAGLAAIRADGSYARIVQRHRMQPSP